jgi:hypothetical protein
MFLTGAVQISDIPTQAQPDVVALFLQRASTTGELPTQRDATTAPLDITDEAMSAGPALSGEPLTGEPLSAERHRERYALACSAVAVAAQVLRTAHDFADEPGVAVDSIDLPVMHALAQARSAAGAMSIIGGKLLVECREEAAQVFPAIGLPVRPEPGVTMSAWDERHTNARAVASASSEALAAARSLAACDAPHDLQQAVAELADLAARAALFVRGG